MGSTTSTSCLLESTLCKDKLPVGEYTVQVSTVPEGFAGTFEVDNVHDGSVYESMSKYDMEIAKCTDYYSRQCAAMESCRGQIAAPNYVAANSRALISDSQATINKCEVDIPTRKLQLSQHLLMCKHELNKLNTRL